MTTGLIFDLKRFAMHDGPGIRLTVFLKGCPLRCWWCHNPESLDPKQQRIDREYKIGNKTVGHQEEIVGRTYTVEQLMAEIEKERLFFDDSGGGVTFSGGEPLLQLDFLKESLMKCREMEIHTALDTSGFAPYSAFEQIAEYVDLFLFDLKLIDEEEHRIYTGVSNKPILDNLRKLATGPNKIMIRFPVIPGVTDTDKNIDSLVLLLKDLKTVRHLSLLPFHNIASAKYERFGLENRFAGIRSFTNEDLTSLQSNLTQNGFNVSLGG